MSRPKSLKPSYCLHCASGRAYVKIDGGRVYLGVHGTQESRDKYDRVIGEWIARGRQPIPAPAPSDNAGERPLAIFELIDAYWQHAQKYYVHSDGTPTSEVECLRYALRPLKRLYGRSAARGFGPLALKVVRDAMIRDDSKDAVGWSRNYTNKQIARLKSMFRWATENELISGGVYQSLKTVAGLKRGRSDARETEPVKPVPLPHVDAVLPFLSRQIRAMVQLQLVTGARGGEICSMRSMDIDTSEDVWIYRPARHKSSHHGHERIIRIGPKGKEILQPFLKSDLSAFIFSPADAEAERLKDRREKRRTPLHCGNGPGDNRKRDPKRTPGDRYEVEAYTTTTWDKVSDTLWVKMKVLLQGWKHQIVWHNRARDIPEMVRIEVDGGFSTIAFKAYEQGREAFQAAACRYVAFDEQFPRDVFIEATSRIGAEYSLDFMAAMTPIESQPWLEERLTSGNFPADEIFEYPLDDNRIGRGGFLKDDEVDAMIENWPPEVRDTRRLGKWGGYTGTVFQTFSCAIHVVPESDESRFFPKGRIPVTANIIGAIDWGGANPFCFPFGTRIPHMDNDWYIFDEYYWDFLLKGGRRLKEHADAILDRTRTTWGGELFRVWADHDPTDANEFAGYGIFSMPADKKLIRPTIECVQGLLNPRKHLANERWPGGRPRLHLAARCVNLLREIPMYHYPDATKNLNAKENPVDKDNHAVSALRYLVYSDPEGMMTVYTPPAELTNDGRRDFLDIM